MASPSKAIAALAIGLVGFSLALAAFTAYAWLMLGDASLYDVFVAALKLLSGFVALLSIGACINVLFRRSVCTQSERQGD